MIKNFILNDVVLKISFDYSNYHNPELEDFKIFCFFNEEKIAHASFYHESGNIYAFEVFVEESYRRMGVATKMYNYAEEISQKKLFPHHENPYNYQDNDVSDDALLFWKNRKR